MNTVSSADRCREIAGLFAKAASLCLVEVLFTYHRESVIVRVSTYLGVEMTTHQEALQDRGYLDTQRCQHKIESEQ